MGQTGHAEFIRINRIPLLQDDQLALKMAGRNLQDDSRSGSPLTAYCENDVILLRRTVSDDAR